VSRRGRSEVPWDLARSKRLDKSVIVTPLVLTKGDLDEIGDVVDNTIETIWGHIEDQYHQLLDKVQQGLKELQVQIEVIQVSVGQLSMPSISVVEIMFELKPIPLPRDSL